MKMKSMIQEFNKRKNSIMKKIVSTTLLAAMTLMTLTAGTTIVSAAPPTVTYIAHCADYGWMNWVSNGQTAGTTNQWRRMEALQIKLSGISGNITYRAHVADIGWMDWVSNGQTAGTTNQWRRMEAIEIKLSGEVASKYDVVYRAHCADVGWMNWVSNGQTAGSTGLGRRMEAIEIKLVAKSNSYTQKMNAFISDSRWKNGASWSASKSPILSSYSSKGCCAYAADFAKYVFNNNSPRGGVRFSNPSEIRSGDILYVSGSSHWIVVLERNGNSLRTAEGNWGNKVVISSTAYTVNGNTLM